MKKKILFLTASYGSGHLTANKAVCDALKILYPGELELKTIDFLSIAGYLSTGGMFRKFYNWSMENPFVWETIFNLTNSPAAQEYFNLILPLFYSSLYRIFEQEKPDIFVLTHPYWNYIVGNYKSKYGKDTPCATIVTDSTAIHYTWVGGPGIDYYIVMDSDTETQLNVMGVELEKILVMGFPISPNFTKEFDRHRFLKGLRLDPDLPILLIVFGLGSLNRFIKIIDLLRMRYDLPFQMVIATSGYDEIYSSLQMRRFLVRTRLIKWTNRMHDYVRASDLVISKGGCAIVMETIASGRPIFIPVLTPGQEKGNAQVIKKYRLGYVEKSLSRVYNTLCDLVSKPYRLKELQAHAARYGKPDACFNIAKWIYSIVNRGG